MAQHTEEAEVMNVSLPESLLARLALRNPEFQQLRESVEQVKCTLGGRSGVKRSGDTSVHSLIDVHSQVLRKLAPVIAVSLWIIFDQPL